MKEESARIMSRTNKLRFVEREGKNILQQEWTTGVGPWHAEQREWRDVAKEVEKGIEE